MQLDYNQLLKQHLMKVNIFYNCFSFWHHKGNSTWSIVVGLNIFQVEGPIFCYFELQICLRKEIQEISSDHYCYQYICTYHFGTWIKWLRVVTCIQLTQLILLKGKNKEMKIWYSSASYTWHHHNMPVADSNVAISQVS